MVGKDSLLTNLLLEENFASTWVNNYVEEDIRRLPQEW
jgi:hypothetical protein